MNFSPHTPSELREIFGRLSTPGRVFALTKGRSVVGGMLIDLRERGLLDEQNELTDKAKLALATTRLKG